MVQGLFLHYLLNYCNISADNPQGVSKEMKDIDWEDIASKLPNKEDTRVQTAKMASMDYWLLKAAASAKKRGLAADAASLLSASVRRLKDEWCEIIAFQAAQEGISFEEMFVKLVEKDPRE